MWRKTFWIRSGCGVKKVRLRPPLMSMKTKPLEAEPKQCHFYDGSAALVKSGHGLCFSNAKNKHFINASPKKQVCTAPIQCFALEQVFPTWGTWTPRCTFADLKGYIKVGNKREKCTACTYHLFPNKYYICQ